MKSACSEDLKLSLLLTFGKVEAEIFEVKDTRGHFQFSHFYAWFLPVLAVRTTLLDFQKSIWHLAILSVIFSTQMTQPLTKNSKEIDFLKILWWNHTEKWLKITQKCENWKWPLVSLTSNISASTWPNFKSKDSFEILRTCSFQNWPYFLVKIWGT